ncbi:MAG: NgoMIV family type II restriction endonuclease [Candidatus Bruticola sp.]
MRLAKKYGGALKMDNPIILEARDKFHAALIEQKVLILSIDGVASNADSSNAPSRAIAEAVAQKLGANSAPRLKGQTAGTLFEQITMQFISSTFPKLQHLRPGEWVVLNLSNQSAVKTWDFAQYEHLAYLSALINKNKQLSTMLGNDYMIAPMLLYTANYAKILCCSRAICRSIFSFPAIKALTILLSRHCAVAHVGIICPKLTL